MKSRRILRVAVLVPLYTLFDYFEPTESTDIAPTLLIGRRILIPFGKQKKIGIIVEVTEESDYPAEKLKTALSMLDLEPLFSKTLLKLLDFTMYYYQATPGEVFETALPSRLTKEKPVKKGKPSQEAPRITASAPNLNTHQQQAVDTITHHAGQYNTYLLEGVTGSGKTEVYICIIEQIIKSQKQALVIVPEIGLTPQLLARFQARFQVGIAVLNSSLTEKKRLEAFEKARTGEALIVVGTRLSAFVPLKAPGIFIIDEEHDPSLKQQEGLRYHARNLIIMRGLLENCPVVLGSATPSLESLYNVQKGRFQKLILPHRTGNAILPSLRVLDIRHKKLEEGLSSQLIEIIRRHIAQKGQVLLFLNRRGFAPVLMCVACGWLANCQNCDAKMTFHAHSKTLQCHHCEVRIPTFIKCPVCGHLDLKPIGMGTERLEATLQKHFPTQIISRIDRDTTRKKGEFQTIMEGVYSGATHIVLGTQMIAKGHHFPNVTLVAILDIDNALFSTDFRSLERLGQLITQVAGRSGRAERPGEVILQTCHPEHPLLKTILEQGYPSFANKLLTERQALALPPYSYQTLIRAEAKTKELALDFLSLIKKEALATNPSEATAIQFSGPVPAPMERRQGQYRAQLLLQSHHRSRLQKVLSELIPKINTYPNSSNIRWSVDVDPIDMY